jgi:hypothetical protein
MDLEHPYFYTANSRLSLFCDDENWAIVFEKSGYANRGGRIELELNYFGNHLRNLQPGGLYHHFNYNSKYFTLVDGPDLDEIQSEFERIAPSAARVKLRGNYVAIPTRKTDYQKWIPNILTRECPEDVCYQDLGRYLPFEYEGLCRSTPQELTTCLPEGVPTLMHIDQWHHRSYSRYIDDEPPQGDKPSSYETFPLIAEVLVSRDPSHWKPTLPPTNHWKNWPDAGSM